MATASNIMLYRYSPENMDETILRKLFVGREKLLKSVLKEIEDSARKKTPRFFLIVGPRGIGKSHFWCCYIMRSGINSDQCLFQ